MTTSSYGALQASFVASGMPQDLADAVLAEYVEVKNRYFLGDHGPGAVKGGRFCEAVARVLQFGATQQYTPLSDEIKLEDVLKRHESNTALDDGLRLHAVRAMRLVYGIRNKRDTGHLKDGIDPNLQDATIVTSCLDWILAELVRVYHSVSPDEAAEMISGIVTKEVPVIEVFKDRPVINADLGPLDHLMVVVYWANKESVTKSELAKWLPARINVGRELKKADAKHLLHVDGVEIFLRAPGKKYVEDRNLLTPAHG